MKWHPSLTPPHFTELDGETEIAPCRISLPDCDWQWVSDWQVKKCDQPDGWSYARSFMERENFWTAKEDTTSLVRRRHWLRMMRCRNEEKYFQFIRLQ